MASVIVRMRAFSRRFTLDAALADGVDPAADPMLALRARQLTSDSTRRALAGAIYNVLDAAEESKDLLGPIGSRPPLRHEGVLAARHELSALARRLCDRGPISPQAAALTAQLVWDSASPIYAETDFTVWEWAQVALERLPSTRVA
jgi:hypothetical protein